MTGGIVGLPGQTSEAKFFDMNFLYATVAFMKTLSTLAERRSHLKRHRYIEPVREQNANG